MTNAELLQGTMALLNIAGGAIAWWMAKRFATRDDLARLEAKVDSLLAISWQRSTNLPDKNRSAE